MCDFILFSHFSPGFWIQVPMENPELRAFDAHDLQEDKESLDTWRWWSDLHRLTEWDRRISLVLRLSADMPSKGDIARWLGEPIKCLVIPTHVFSTNKRRLRTWLTLLSLSYILLAIKYQKTSIVVCNLYMYLLYVYKRKFIHLNYKPLKLLCFLSKLVFFKLINIIITSLAVTFFHFFNILKIYQ